MNRTIFTRPLIFIVGGAIAGFLSLVFSSVISLLLPSESGYFPLFVLVLIEEFTKFSVLTILFRQNSLAFSSRFALVLFGALPFGLGFGVFELGLIFLSSSSVPSGALAIVIIHLITSILLSLAVFSMKIDKKETIGYILILLAVLIHMWYNTFVISIAN